MSMKIFVTSIFLMSYIAGYSADSGSDDIVTSAGEKTYHLDKKYLDLKDNPVIKNGQDTLKADSIKYFNEENKGIGIGNVKLYDHENAIEVFGEFIEYFTKSKYAKIKTNAKLIAIKDQITVNSEFMERFGEEKIYIARNNVVIKLERENATATCDQGIYEILKKRFILRGHSKIYHGGSQYSADEIFIYTESKNIVLLGNAQIIKGNQKVLAGRIKYYSKDPNKKAILTGHPKLIEYSANDSLLGGKPYRIARAKKILYYNVQKGKARLLGDAKISEFYVDEEKGPNNSMVDIVIYKRTGEADEIKYIGGNPSKYALIGNAKITEAYRSGFAERIDFSEGANKKAIFKGDPVLYEFFKKKEVGYSPNKIKRKASAEIIEYYFKRKKLVLKKEALIEEENLKVRGEYLEYNDGIEPSGFALGDASIRRKEDYAHADHIRFFGGNKDRLILTGHAYYENEDMEVEADSIDHQNKIHKTIMKGHVTIYDDDKKAFADHMVYTKKNGVEKAVLKGNSGLIDKDKKAHGNIIEYTKKENKELLFLKGKASFVKKDKTVFADQIIYYTLGNKSKDNDEKMILKDNVKIVEPDRITKGDNGVYFIKHKNKKTVETGYLIGNCEIINKNGSQRAFSDKIEYLKDEDCQETMKLIGNAEVSDDSKAGYANEITFYPNFEGENEDKYVMLGKPRIEDEVSRTTGKRIKIISGTRNQIRVFNDGKYINDEDDIEITGGYLFFDEEKDLLRAEKNPVFINKKDNVTVYSDQMESYRKKKISIATGDVKIIQKKKTIYGERAKYYEEKKKMVVTGNASIVEDDNVSRAKKIILNTKKETVELIDIIEGQLNTSGSK
ncbi:MAG: hypothetical protein IEMM0008_0125 [bacterium]|nr:MAG: hypothetical protein IEMM0008_0125 [bacterium]